MMIHRAKTSGEFMAASIGAVLIAGLIYVGVLLLNDAQQPEEFTMVEGAIRLAQPQKDKTVEPLKRKQLKETKPPERLPRKFSSKSKPKQSKPMMNVRMPNFTPDMHPGLGGDFSLPASELGGIGFSLDEVDEVPQVLRSVPPEYPYGAKRNHVEGEVVIRMLVTNEGTPTNMSVHSATPTGVFDKVALSAAKRWKFRPGQYHGQAVDTWVLLPFNFELTR